MTEREKLVGTLLIWYDVFIDFRSTDFRVLRWLKKVIHTNKFKLTNFCYLINRLLN